jgi:hypothetical protein
MDTIEESTIINERSLFLTLFIIGFVLLLLITFSEANPLFQLIVTGVVFFYAVMISRIKNRTIEQVDSIYYLGFVFTLSSLLVSLVSMAVIGDEINARTVLAAFSVALSTTIVGIIGKLLLSQFLFGSQEEHLERQIKRLDEQFQSLAGSVSLVEVEMSESFSTLNKNVSNHAVQMEKISSTIMDTVSSNANSIFTKFTEELSLSFDLTNSKMQQGVTKNMDIANRHISDLMKKNENAYNAMNESSTNNLDILSKVVSQISEEINQFKILFKDANDQFYGNVESITDGYITSLSKSSMRITDAAADVDNYITANLDAISSDTLNIDVGALSSTYADLVKNLEKHSKGVTEAIRAGSVDIENAESSFAEIHKVADRLGDVMNALSKIDTDAVSNGITCTVSNLQERLQEATKINNKLISVVSSSACAIVDNLNASGKSKK